MECMLLRIYSESRISFLENIVPGCSRFDAVLKSVGNQTKYSSFEGIYAYLIL